VVIEEFLHLDVHVALVGALPRIARARFRFANTKRAAFDHEFRAAIQSRAL
jgi:hypothetical protein